MQAFSIYYFIVAHTTSVKKFNLLKPLALFLCAFCVSGLLSTTITIKSSGAIPLLSNGPKEFTLRAEFYTSYNKSSMERKNNIKIASKKINDYFLDVGYEFSFNKVVGARTEKNGFKQAKIIVNGKFVDGIGGGVCQVSTTLYNAVLLAGLKVTEYHAHSLPVSYVAPSFDAMVNSGYADLKFVNTTSMPIIIKSTADGERIKISIYGEKMKEKYVRESIITGEVVAPKEEILIDEKLEYPDLLEGEQKVINYSKNGYYSKGRLIKYENGKMICVVELRKDKYNATKGLIIEGKAKKEQNLNLEAI